MFGQAPVREPESQPQFAQAPQQPSTLFSGVQQGASSNAFGSTNAAGPVQQTSSSFGGGQQGGFSFSSSPGTQQTSGNLFGTQSRPVSTVQFSAPQPSFGQIAPVQQGLNPAPVSCHSVGYPTAPTSGGHDTVVTAFEVEGAVADLLMNVCGKRFRVCSRLLSSRSGKVQQEVSSKEPSSVTIVVDLPLATDPTPFVKWLHTVDMAALLASVTTLEAQVDMLALGVYLDLNPELHFEARVLSTTFAHNISVYSALPPCWDRAFIPLDLAIKTINKYRNTHQSIGLFGGFGTNQPSSTAIQMALEWLGERRCFSTAEIESLKESAEFRGMKRVLQENYYLPTGINDYVLLAKRYPVGIDVFTIGDMFKALGLI